MLIFRLLKQLRSEAYVTTYWPICISNFFILDVTGKSTRIFCSQYFYSFGGIIPYLLGVVMLGMGLTVSLDDFKLILKEPKPVIIGVFLQYTIMPFAAYAVVKLFHLPADIAIGVLLVGCCPGGTSSNVVSYLAKGNVSLSVTITSISTI